METIPGGSRIRTGETREPLKKSKKPLSEKQKAHLDRIRKLASGEEKRESS